MHKDPRDLSAINKAKEFNTRLLWGDKHPEEIEAFKQFMEKKLLSVEVIGATESKNGVSNKIPGLCIPLANGCSKIIMRGFKNCNYNSYQFTIHEFIHEYWHAFLNAASFLNGESKYTRTYTANNGRTYKKTNGDGVIQIVDPTTNTLQKEYGLMFLETSADIFTTLSLMAFEPMFPRENVNVDTVFEKHYGEWGDAPTGYSIFTTLTRLLIAAFSNSGLVSYQNLVNNGYSIFSTKIKDKKGNTIFLNDFLHGITSDPLFIEKQYDKFMGQGEYERLCTQMDNIFSEYNRTQIITSQMRLRIKWFIITVANFLNKKLGWMMQCGTIDTTNKLAIISKFNRIWNTMANEYGFIITQTDIAEINRKASESTTLHIF